MPTKIIYILSFARSGSTLLGNILGSDDSHFHIGEFERMWLRNRREAVKGRNRTCGCLQLIRECPVWAEAFDRVASDLGLGDNETLFDAFVRGHLQPPAWDSTLGQYSGVGPELTHLIRSVYPHISDVTGREWIVDSSKSLSYLELLRSQFSDEDLHVIHLVRDVRGVVASRMRSMTEKHEMSVLRRVPPVTKDVVDWNQFNRRAEATFGDMANYSLVRYDDLVRDLPGVMAGQLAGLGYRHVGEGDRVTLPVNHTVNGNRNRVLTGETILKEDLRWKKQLSPTVKRLVGVASWRSLRHYGFSA